MSAFAINEPLSPAVRKWVLDEQREHRRRDLNRRMREAFASRDAAEPAPVSSFVPDPYLYPEPGSVWEYEDEGFYTPAAEVEQISDEDRRFAFSASGRFYQLAAAETGRIAPDEKLKKSRRDAAELIAQSHAIAEKMKPHGFDCYRDTPFGLYLYYVHSRHVEKLPGFRRVCFIPAVAQAIRRPMVAALEYFLEKNPLARMWVFTSGTPTPLCDVRERVKYLHRKISTLNAQDFMKETGAEIVFRATELGTPEWDSNGQRTGGEIERDEAGNLFFHVHAHCIVKLKFGKIAPRRWEKLLKQVGAFWVHWWKDGSDEQSGIIRDAREVCKYVTKPGEMLKLSGAELCELQRQLSRLKLCQPLGVLAEEIKAREEHPEPKRIVRLNTPEGPVLTEELNWNKRPRRTKEEKNYAAGENLGARESKVDTLQVVSRLLPGFGPCGVSEPRVLILAQNWDEAAARADVAVSGLVAATAEAFGAGMRKSIRVHVCTSTVLEPRQFAFVETLPPPRAVLSGAELAGLSR